MDNATQDLYIQKKLLYKFEKKFEDVYQEYLNHIFSEASTEKSAEPQKGINSQKIFEDIQNLEFQNFKYRAALLASNKDLIINEEMISQQQAKIASTRDQIKELSQRYRRAQLAKKHKQQFNEIGQIIMKFEKRQVLDSKISTIERQINELDDKFNKDMENYQNRERYLRASLSALNSFLAETSQNQKELESNKSPKAQLANGEDDGQIY